MGRHAAHRARVMEALAAAPDGLSAPQIRAALGVGPEAASGIRHVLLDALASGEVVRDVTAGRYARSPRRGGRNVPVVVFRVVRPGRRRRPPAAAETRRKISEAASARRGRPVSPETRRKISEANKGRRVSPETRARMSAAARLRHGRQDGMITEKITENCQPRPGEMGTRTFWIAYPAHVAAYGHKSDRVSRSLGSGETKKAALAAAGKRG